MLKKDVILSVDAGGTKTKVVLFDKDKNIIYEKIGPPGSPAVLREKALENIYSLVLDVLNETKMYNIKYIQMGISGLGVVSDKEYYQKKWTNDFGIEVSLENDAVLALYSVIEDKYEQGIVILAGTGSACCATNGNEILINGGWGHLLTETGSSYASVKMLITKMIYEYEETRNISVLGKKFMKEIGISNINNIRSFMYFNDKYEIASYSKFIYNEALKGDLEAINILKKCGDDLAHRVILLYKHTGIDNNCLLGFRGGFITNISIVQEEIIACLNSNGYNPIIVNIKVDPIIGGYYLAKRKDKI